MHYLIAEDILVEEHIVGIPGDVFITDWMQDKHINQIRLAKELVKFNERSFIRLLGDMRSYNFVVDVTPDFEDIQIRIRPMDFDQQSYSGRLKFYLPQFFKDNNPLVEFCVSQLNIHTAKQYQKEEHAVFYRRIQLAESRVNRIIDCMSLDRLSSEEKVKQLASGLAHYHKDKSFEKCTRMGELLRASIIRVQNNVQKQRQQINSVFEDDF